MALKSFDDLIIGNEYSVDGVKMKLIYKNKDKKSTDCLLFIDETSYAKTIMWVTHDYYALKTKGYYEPVRLGEWADLRGLRKDDVVEIRCTINGTWLRRHVSHVDLKRERVVVYNYGRSSKTASENSTSQYTRDSWRLIKDET